KPSANPGSPAHCGDRANAVTRWCCRRARYSWRGVLMSHLHRFYLPEPPAGDRVLLPPEEAHHALRVLRVQVGDLVALFDGRGREWSGRVAGCSKREV